MEIKNYQYKIYSPCGNETALVLGGEDNADIRRLINAYILGKFSSSQKEKNGFVVEQVGFIDINTPKLVMAGGEFCGNAARTAAWHYLNGVRGEINISVSGVKNTLKAGVNGLGEAWAQMPVYKNLDVREITDGFYLVKMEGIAHLVIEQENAKQYLESSTQSGCFEETLKMIANALIKKNNLGSYDAAGVIFLENTGNGVKMHPCVFVKKTGTYYYETACGSGAIAAGLVRCFKSKSGGKIKMSLLQPSNQSIRAIIDYNNEQIDNAVICGSIKYRGDGVLNISLPKILLIKNWNEFSRKEEFYKLYKECFSEPPYEEYHDDVEQEGLFSQYCKEGKLLYAYDSEADKTVAFAAAVPLEKDTDIINIIRNKGIDFDVSRDWYYADIGISKDFRGRKIGFILGKTMLEALPDTAGKIFMRTRNNNQASISLHEKIGFKVISGSLHDSPTRKKKSGGAETGPNVLLEYKR